MTKDDAALATFDAVGQGALVASGELAPRDLTMAAITRLERVNPQINAVIHDRSARASREVSTTRNARFAGVPVVVKDFGAPSAGDAYHLGMRFLRDRDAKAHVDSHLVKCLRGAGFVLVGRANTAELASSFTTEPLAYGPTLNPWDPVSSVGGSSGGSAAAVAAGIVPVAHGNDMGGSVRVPAAYTGTVGLKFSRGRTSAGPTDGELLGLVGQDGIITGTIRDAAALMAVVSVPCHGDPYSAPAPRTSCGAPSMRCRLRVGLLDRDPTGVVEVDPFIESAVRNVSAVLADLGHVVDESFPAALSEDGSSSPGNLVFAVGLARRLEDIGDRWGVVLREGDVEPATWEIAEAGRRATAVEYSANVESAIAWGRRLTTWWIDHDLLVTPTVPVRAPKIGDLAPTTELPTLWSRMGPIGTFTTPFNISGQPAISLPAGVDDLGMPIGVQIVAPYGREDLLIRTALELEAAMPWSGRLPSIHATIP